MRQERQTNFHEQQYYGSNKKVLRSRKVGDEIVVPHRILEVYDQIVVKMPAPSAFDRVDGVLSACGAGRG